LAGAKAPVPRLTANGRKVSLTIRVRQKGTHFHQLCAKRGASVARMVARWRRGGAIIAKLCSHSKKRPPNLGYPKTSFGAAFGLFCGTLTVRLAPGWRGGRMASCFLRQKLWP